MTCSATFGSHGCVLYPKGHIETVDFLASPLFHEMDVSAGKCQLSASGPTCKVDMLVGVVHAGG